MIFRFRDKKEMHDSGIDWIGIIPVGWNIIRLKDISKCNINSVNERNVTDSIINYIDIGSVTTGQINYIQEMLFSEAPSRARRIVKEHDIIISTVRTYLKAVAFLEQIREIITTRYKP